MPYVKRQASVINKADSCGAGMKKSGLVSTSGWSRIPQKILKSRSPNKVPPFMLTCSSRGPSSFPGTSYTRVHGLFN